MIQKCVINQGRGPHKKLREFGNQVVREQKRPISRFDPEQTLKTLLIRVRTVLKFKESPWKVLKFLCKSLPKSPWIFFSFECSDLESVFWCFLVVEDFNTNHSSENLKVIYVKCFMSYAIINYQVNAGELKNVETLVKQTVQALLE